MFSYIQYSPLFKVRSIIIIMPRKLRDIDIFVIEKTISCGLKIGNLESAWN